ncbi:ABC transporter ATP-binding protein [Wenxinia saemankumensis]|uniref:Peptide/nickel transport system ATP-binding protein n=1 Tax=Wenxinia saemankumensis TaxID=1447782 RepID=A0A1M6ARU1_9RHOB|nr:ABC transporter ATP-binding protein [Wenxinia saemankumensis]SHI39239.1 peptide/nickel transport system ATP-binding protein [Wenxinia saemankumensis]
MSGLAVEGLCVEGPAGPILQDVSFAVGPGEIVALTGESGSGKSMTALSLMRLLPEGLQQKAGRVTLGGTDLGALTERQMCRVRGARIGMVFQEPMTALNPVQTIGAQVTETLRLHAGVRRDEAEAKARDMLARVGLPEERFPLTRYPHELSGGQRQRVVIALAICQRPEVLIADEPTTALDVTTQAQILDLLRALVAEFGMGLILITHDLAVVAGMADRLVVMKDGGVVEQGATAEVLRTPREGYTRALLAASSHRPAAPPARQGTPLLQVRDVVRTYPGARAGLFGARRPVTAVDGVSLTIGQGERVGLVGESGCGKSTLTRAILGLEPVQAGSIALDGQPVEAVRGRIQVVFQDPYGSFNPRHRVRRLVSEPFHLLPRRPGTREGAARVAEALEAVGLRASDSGRYIHEFSGGQRQRIAMARALILRPDLIVLDEAVSALDVSVRARILDLLSDLSARLGLAYLFISHDLAVVRGVTERVLVMKAGRIVEEGATEAVFAAPRHPYTAELIAAAPVLPDWTAREESA